MPPAIAIGTSTLPAPCSGVPYHAELFASGGDEETYRWEEIVPLPQGLRLEPGGAIEGTPLGEGSFSLRVSDAEGNASETKEFYLSWRQDCWLAYVSSDGGESARLHYRDVFLQNDIVLPSALAAGEAVADYRFSPDGVWIAIRVAALGGYRIELYSTSLGEPGGLSTAATRLAFDCAAEVPGACSVLDYAWSDDGAHLAVVLSGGTDRQDYLSGVDVAALDAPWPVTATADDVDQVIPLDYRSGLIWVGSDWLAFMGPEPVTPDDLEVQTLYSAVRSQTGGPLASVRATRTATLGSPVLRRVPAGLVLAQNRGDEVFLFSRNLSGGTTTDRLIDLTGRVSPSGRLIARANPDAQLQVTALSQPVALPVESDRGTCEQILAWSNALDGTGVERIACRVGSLLKIFDYSDPPPQSGLDANPRVTPTDELDLGEISANVRLAFTHSAQWLVVQDPVTGYALLSLWEDVPRLSALPSTATEELQVAPERDAFVLAGPELLNEFRLPEARGGGRSYETFGAAASESLACDDLSLDSWCGLPAIANHIVYSRDASGLMFEGPAAVLWLAELSVEPQASATRLTATASACTLGCKGDVYSFAPSRE